MVKHKGKVDPALKGKHGRTALHIAAILDHAECVKILVSFLPISSTSSLNLYPIIQLKDNLTCPRIPCENGYYPIHVSIDIFYLSYSRLPFFLRGVDYSPPTLLALCNNVLLCILFRRPNQEAARNASANALQAILQFGECSSATCSGTLFMNSSRW